MADKWVSTKSSEAKGAAASKAASSKTAPKRAKIDDEKFAERVFEIHEEIGEGLGNSAEETILHVLESYELKDEQKARLAALNALSCEIRGEHKRSLEILEDFLAEHEISGLEPETQILISSRLANSYCDLDQLDQAKAIVEETLEISDHENVDDYLSDLLLTRSKINEKLGDLEGALSDADKALDHFRDAADWRGMAWSYYQMGKLGLAEGRAKKALDYFNLAIQMVGENSAPVVLGRVFADMAGAYWFQNEAKKGVECLEKAVEFFTQTENQLQQIFAFNDLGASLTLLGDFRRAEECIKNALDIADERKHPHIAGIYDSYAELKLLKHELVEALKFAHKGIEASKQAGDGWYLVQNMRTLARCQLAEEKLDESISIARGAQNTASKVGESPIDNLLRLVLAEAYLLKDETEDAEAEIKRVEKNNPESDFFVFGNTERIRGLIALKKENRKAALNHFRKALSIFETRGDAYHTALIHFQFGETYFENSSKKAIENFISASETFRKLGVKKLYNQAEKHIRELEKPKRGKKKKVEPLDEDANTQLLMQRLAEATASRELLFRELVAILQQESKVGRFIVADSDESDGFKPLLVDGYNAVESNQLVGELTDAIKADDVKRFAKTKNARVCELRPAKATPAILLIFPRYSAKLNNGGKIDPLLRIVELGMDVCALRDIDSDGRVIEDKNPFVSQSIMPGFIHSSPAMTKLVEEVYKIRSSDVTVLITGESGTGKELVSRAIHSVSARKDKVFVPFNCTAVPKELTEGHLFGYRRGAFTGAQNDSPGMIKTADGGTLLLDEIGDLPIDVQPKLLRFLQEGEIQPLGEKKPFKVDVRVIAATNMDLEERVKNGLFREDLFYRINVVRLKVPPLRERKSEIKPMVKYYINHYSARFNKKDISIKPQTIDTLMVSDWEGNVRQLCNEIQRIVARAEDGEVITPDHISPELKKQPEQRTYDEQGNVKPLTSGSAAGLFSVGMEGTTIEEAVSELETQMIIDAMRRNDGNITRVSKELGLTRRGLYMKIKRYGIERAS